jgi:hypothetical protein
MRASSSSSSKNLDHRKTSLPSKFFFTGESFLHRKPLPPPLASHSLLRFT